MKKPPYRLIAFTARLQHGKTTAAKILEEQGYVIVSFATPLKEMLITMGLTWEQLTTKKHEPCELLGGATPRRCLQILGTEVGRGVYDGIWVNIARRKIEALWAEGKNVCVDDCRFLNEAQMIAALGGILVRIERPDLMPVRHWWTPLMFWNREHTSEAGFDSRYVDLVIQNDGTPEDLKDRIHAVVDGTYARACEIYGACARQLKRPLAA